MSRRSLEAAGGPLSQQLESARMAAKHRGQNKKRRGPRGRTGAAGPEGPAGPAGRDHATEIASLSEQVAAVMKQLRTQLIRIAQIQVQLDHLARGRAPRLTNLRGPRRNDN